jgi:hypothetical protein
MESMANMMNPDMIKMATDMLANNPEMASQAMNM